MVNKISNWIDLNSINIDLFIRLEALSRRILGVDAETLVQVRKRFLP